MLARFPNDPDALHILGLLLGEQVGVISCGAAPHRSSHLRACGVCAGVKAGCWSVCSHRRASCFACLVVWHLVATSDQGRGQGPGVGEAQEGRGPQARHEGHLAGARTGTCCVCVYLCGWVSLWWCTRADVGMCCSTPASVSCCQRQVHQREPADLKEAFKCQKKAEELFVKQGVRGARPPPRVLCVCPPLVLPPMLIITVVVVAVDGCRSACPWRCSATWGRCTTRRGSWSRRGPTTSRHSTPLVGE